MVQSDNANNKNEKVYSAPALEKGLDILELLAEKKRPMTMPQMSAALNRSKSEIYRMTTVLQNRDYLLREDGSDYFQITNKLFDLGMSVSPVGTLLESAYPIMHELSESIQQSSHIAVISGNRIVIVARVESTSVFGFSIRVGRYASLYDSTSGAVLLAWMSNRERRKQLESHAKTDKDFDVSAFESELESIRNRGWLQKKSEDVSGITDIGVPIFSGDDRYAIACLIIPYLSTSNGYVTLSKARELTKKAAEEISSLSVTHHGL